MRVLGLDVSTSTVGWAIVESEDMSLIKLGHWSLKKVDGLFHKTDHVLNNLQQLMIVNNVSSPVWIEEPALMFTMGMSSAQTIATLIRINSMISYGIHSNLKAKVSYVKPGEARRSCNLTLTTKAKAGGKSQKEQVYLQLTAVNGYLSHIKFPLTKTGKPKPENYDETDAYVIARHGATILQR
jgi:hypothetical protein